jgi:hypothetical protein
MTSVLGMDISLIPPLIKWGLIVSSLYSREVGRGFRIIPLTSLMRVRGIM